MVRSPDRAAEWLASDRVETAHDCCQVGHEGRCRGRSRRWRGRRASGSSSAGAQEAPPVPPWLQDIGQQLLTQYGPQILEFQDQVDGFIQGLKPADDPNVAETTADSSGAVTHGHPEPRVHLRSERGRPQHRQGDHLQLPRHRHPHQGRRRERRHLRRHVPRARSAIDWVNDKTCPGGHGGEDLCVTFLGSSATTKTTTDGQPVTLTKTIAELLAPSVPSQYQGVLAAIPALQTPITAHGVSEGTSTDNKAEFHLLKASKGGDSIALLPNSASSSSFELADGNVTTDPFTIARFKPLPNAGFPLNLVQIGPFNVPSQTFPVSGLPRTCSNAGEAHTVTGTGIFGEIAAFFDTPKTSSATGVGAECELVSPTSGN